MYSQILNLNIGILGHVDSGKTSLAKALSNTSSTASFDKNPQSQERGITIDIGFSSAIVDFPQNLKNSQTDCWKYVQFTFVDCPGHASLIRTVIGGAQIIDMILLVIDITKGMQTQTAECLIIGEITCKKMIVVLNKIDLLPEAKREQTVKKVKKKMSLTLENTIFKDAPIACIAARPGDADADNVISPIGIDDLIDMLRNFSFIPERSANKPFVMAVDHCFIIKGQGTVITGTVLQGSINVNDVVEIPSLNVKKKLKSIQIFRQNVEKAVQGDRVGVSVTQLDAKLLERGILSTEGYVPLVYAVIIMMNKVKYFKTKISSKAKFHISIGHETVIGKITLFSSKIENKKDDSNFNFTCEYLYQNDLYDPDDNEQSSVEDPGTQFALIEFEKPVFVIPHSLVIGSKLDLDIHTSSCRLAFFGNVSESIVDKNYSTTVLPKLQVFKLKSKTGILDRVINEYEVIGRNIFKKETKIELFSGLRVNLSSGEEGIIEQSFGQSGKIRIRVPQGLNESTMKKYSKEKSKQLEHDQSEDKGPVQIILKFKSYVYDVRNKITQR